jgi:hypothetical protein
MVEAFNKAELTLKAEDEGNVYIYRVIAVPKERFDVNYIKMAPKCIMKNNVYV